MTTKEFEEVQLRLDIEAVLRPGERVSPLDGLTEEEMEIFGKQLQTYFERRD